MRIAINGFGRIGRNVLRASLENEDLEFVVINDLTDAKTLAHLLKYDSVFGILEKDVTCTDNTISVGGKDIAIVSERDPSKLPWRKYDIDLVMECTGLFTAREKASAHLGAGAKKVVISAPAKEPDFTVCMGVNEDSYDPSSHHILSNASCTTNCLAPVAKVLLDEFGIKRGLMTTIHAYTNDQKILDLPHSDLRRARAAGLSMIPTTTGAAKAVSLVIPELKGKLDGLAVRVPTPNVSLIDLVAELEKDASEKDVNNAIRNASEGSFKGILQYCDEPLVSIDFKGNPHSSIFDALSTKVLGNRMVKVLAWYDNEWGFSCRMRDLACFIASKGL
ncbi:MAG: type I glyceraldehyde-3-phosphate dehydrogenase [Thermodesulfobacteriota bacterium]